jgi:hypothetical protein
MFCARGRPDGPLVADPDVDGTLLPMGGDAPGVDWDESWQTERDFVTVATWLREQAGPGA